MHRCARQPKCHRCFHPSYHPKHTPMRCRHRHGPPYKRVGMWQLYQNFACRRNRRGQSQIICGSRDLYTAYTRLLVYSHLAVVLRTQSCVYFLKIRTKFFSRPIFLLVRRSKLANMDSMELMLDVCWKLTTTSSESDVHEARLHLAVLMRTLMHLDPRRLVKWIRELPGGHPGVWESPRDWTVYFLVRSPRTQDVVAGYQLVYHDLLEANPTLHREFDRVFKVYDGRCTCVDLHRCGLRRIPDTLGMINIQGGYMDGNLHLHMNSITTLPRSVSNMHVSGNVYMHSNLIDSLPGDFENLRIGGKLLMYNNAITQHLPGGACVLLHSRMREAYTFLIP